MVGRWSPSTCLYLRLSMGDSFRYRVDYNKTVVAKEIGFAAAASANTLRVHLNWIPWFLDPNTFMANLEHLVSTAALNHIKVILAVFDSTGCCDPTPAWVANGQYNSTGWVQNPGQAMVNNASSWPVLDTYVAALTAAYGQDARVLGWDVMYQPQLDVQQPNGGKKDSLPVAIPYLALC